MDLKAAYRGHCWVNHSAMYYLTCSQMVYLIEEAPLEKMTKGCWQIVVDVLESATH